jgi:hypothetical protein
MDGSTGAMTLSEALEKTATLDLGVEARCVKRRDRRGRIWYLIGAREKLFLVRQDKTGFIGVSHKFASQWDDWRPQTTEDAAREALMLDTPDGRRVRNVILGLVLGPLPEEMPVPDFLPSDL